MSHRDLVMRKLEGERDALLCDVDSIQQQLGSNNRIDGSGRRLDFHEYEEWRHSAKAALRSKLQNYRAIKKRVNELRAQVGGDGDELSGSVVLDTIRRCFRDRDELRAERTVLLAKLEAVRRLAFEIEDGPKLLRILDLDWATEAAAHVELVAAPVIVNDAKCAVDNGRVTVIGLGAGNIEIQTEDGAVFIDRIAIPELVEAIRQLQRRAGT